MREVHGQELALYSALAQQCFINEYVFASGDDEIRQAIGLRECMSDQLANARAISPLLIPAVAAYFPLHRLANAELLLTRKWPGDLDDSFDSKSGSRSKNYATAARFQP